MGRKGRQNRKGTRVGTMPPFQRVKNYPYCERHGEECNPGPELAAHGVGEGAEGAVSTNLQPQRADFKRRASAPESPEKWALLGQFDIDPGRRRRYVERV